ncbi:MAG: tyrosine-type recombinase/integrase [Candidatus Heimdallarchaeaceae archaeon]
MAQKQFHHYGEMIESALKRNERIPLHGNNNQIVKDFYAHLFSIDISKPRIAKYLNTLKMINGYVQKDFSQLTKVDIVKFVNFLNEHPTYSIWTKRDYKIILRKLLQWLMPKEEYEEVIGWLKAYVKRRDQPMLSDGDLLTDDEIAHMLKMCSNSRDKALISILSESGARIGEIGTLKLKNVSFDKYGVNLNVNGKTGARKVRVVQSTHYLMSWLESHPDSENKESPLWTTFHKGEVRTLRYAMVRKTIQRIAEKAEIKKRVHPHLFRHSRATKMADHLTELQMNAYFGWIQGSNMPGTYVHMNGKNIDEAILKMNGIGEDEEVSKPEPKKCVRCGHINPSNMQNCIRCAGFLDQKAVFEQEEFERKKQEVDEKSNDILKSLMKDPQIQELVIKRLRETGQLAEVIHMT